jgi:hypothetical protein
MASICHFPGHFPLQKRCFPPFGRLGLYCSGSFSKRSRLLPDGSLRAALPPHAPPTRRESKTFVAA